MQTLNTTPLETTPSGFSSTPGFYSINIGGLDFDWSGGTYIDVSKDGEVIDVLNIWNYETDAPDIDNDLESFGIFCLYSYDFDDLAGV
jgi:hypothetical protein